MTEPSNSTRPTCYNRQGFNWKGKEWTGCSQTEEDLRNTPTCEGCKWLGKALEVTDISNV